MAGKVLSIEVGYAMTKVCEMDYKAKKPKVYRYFSMPTPDGILADGMITVTEEYTNNLKAELTKHKMRTKDVVFSISSSKIATREIRIPYCKESNIGNLVRVNLSDYFPIDVSQYMSAHTILETEGVRASEEKSKAKPAGYRLLILAAPNAIIESYKLLAAALKLNVKEIDYCGNSIYQAAKEECAEGTQLIVKIDSRSSLILAQKDGRIIMTRTIPYGIAEAEEFAESMVPAEDTEEMPVNRGLMSLVEGISKVVDYYNSNHSKEPIERICLTGVGADFDGLRELTENEIQTKVRILTNLTGINTEKVFKGESFGEYAACIGAALAPIHFASDKDEDGKSSSKNGIDPLRLTTLISVGCVLIGVVLVLTSLFPYLEEKQKNENYNAIIAQLEPVYDVYMKHQSLSAQVMQMEALDGMTVNRNEDLLEFITALETKMPISFSLSDLAVTTEGITMNVTVKSKEEVAVVLSELRKLESFSFVDTTTVSELTSEIGETQYSFSVEMTYAPMEEETEEGGE